MADRIYADVNPVLLQWARSASGYSVPVAAKKIGTSPDRLTKFEAGELKPTVRQLRAAAHVYRRPLATFFLNEPPTDPPPLHDFRRLPGVDISEPSPDLLFEMRRAQRRRAVALDLLMELGTEVPRLRLRADVEGDVDAPAQRAREWLGVSLADQESWKSDYDPLNGWIAALESRGVLVFQTGEVQLEEMRGFSLTDTPLPAIVLNGKDRPRARVFTLMHEFGHLLIKRGGLCDPTRVGGRGRTENERIEIFCNRFAGTLLIPTDALHADPAVREIRGPQWSDETLRTLADRFSVSREVVLLRLLSIGRTTQAFVSEKLTQYRQEYARLAAQRTEQAGFAPLHRIAVRDNGREYVRLVLRALDGNRITFADAADYLGVRLKHLNNIADDVGVAAPSG